MELVPGAQPRIRDYWPRYRNRKLLVIVSLHVIGTFMLTLLFVYVHIVPLDPAPLTMFFVISFLMLFIEVGLFFYAAQPIKILTEALAHSAGEEISSTLPNPNAHSSRANGLQPLLKQIYSYGATAPDDNNNDSNGILTAALDNTSASIVVMDAHQKILYASKNAPIYRDPADQPQLSLQFDGDDNLSNWLSDNSKKRLRSNTQWLRVPDKTVGEDGRRIFDVVASFEKSNQAEVVLVFFDRTSIYQPEDDQLDFVAFAAHELRGPITVIKGYLDVLSEELDATIDDEQKVLLKRLVISANRLSGYINNILNASRFDRQHMKIHLSEQTLPAIYDIVRDDMNMRASAQHRLLAVSFPDDLPTVAADSSSLSEVFSNLIDNAIKYSNEGGSIEINATVDGDFVRVIVQDHGIGIPENVIANLFHKFYRSHRSRETVAGTGIGLYICRAIIESHGGQIEVTSEEGRGSTFSFTVPVYASVVDKLGDTAQDNTGIIRNGNEGWIKNHAKYRG